MITRRAKSRKTKQSSLREFVQIVLKNMAQKEGYKAYIKRNCLQKSKINKLGVKIIRVTKIIRKRKRKSLDSKKELEKVCFSLQVVREQIKRSGHTS